MMRKMVLVPYDKYERLLSGQFTQPKPLSITDTDRDQVTIDTSQRDNLHPISPDNRTDDSLTSLPLSLRSRAEVILNHLNKHTNLHWNDKGEIIIDGHLIKGSNITDFIKIQLKDYKSFHPVGTEVFSQLVQESNVPQSVLTHTRRSHFGSGKIPPPPGKPVRRKSSVKSLRHKWITV